MMNHAIVFLSYVFLTSAVAPMTYSNVCENNICRKFSTLILGTDHLGQVPDQTTIDVLNEAVRLGINTFDTAPIYINSEYRLGNWLRTLNRDTTPPLYTITKGGFPFDTTGYGFGFGTYSSRLKGSVKQITANVLKEIGESLKQLPSEISLYLMHRDDFDALNYEIIDRVQTPEETILEALSDPQLRSKFVMLGLSNWKTTRINHTQIIADRKKFVRPVANSPYFSLMEMRDDDTTIHVGGVQVHHEEMMKESFQRGVKIMPYSPLAGISLFSKTWDEAKAYAYKQFQDGDRYWSHVYDAIFHEENEKRFYRAMKFTSMYNLKHNTSYTLDQIVNAWALAHTRLDHLIIGPRSVEALRRTVDVLTLYKTLTKEDLDYLYYN